MRLFVLLIVLVFGFLCISCGPRAGAVHSSCLPGAIKNTKVAQDVHGTDANKESSSQQKSQ